MNENNVLDEYRKKHPYPISFIRMHEEKILKIESQLKEIQEGYKKDKLLKDKYDSEFFIFQIFNRDKALEIQHLLGNGDLTEEERIYYLQEEEKLKTEYFKEFNDWFLQREQFTNKWKGEVEMERKQKELRIRERDKEFKKGFRKFKREHKTYLKKEMGFNNGLFPLKTRLIMTLIAIIVVVITLLSSLVAIYLNLNF